MSLTCLLDMTIESQTLLNWTLKKAINDKTYQWLPSATRWLVAGGWKVWNSSGFPWKRNFEFTCFGHYVMPNINQLMRWKKERNDWHFID